MQYNGKGEHYLQPMLACDLCLWVCGMGMWNINSMWLPQRHELMPSTHAPPPPANPSIQFAYSIPRYYLSDRHLHLITLVWMWVDHVLRGIVQCPCVSVADARWIMSPFPLAPILIYECRKWESIHYPFPATSLSIFHQSPCFAPIVAGSNHKTNSSTHLLHSRPHATGLPVRQSSAQATLATTPNLLISTAIATFQYTHTHTRCRYNGIERGYQISRSNKFCPTANWLCLCDKLNWTHGRCVAVFVCVWKRQRRRPFRAGARAREHGAHANGEQWRRWWQWHLGFSLQLREEGYRLIFCGND